ncbi:MAG TPA: hypothetical protein DCP97_03590 [Ruminococcaceae bacterium]|nr:hypothetical protein [Oscillospiraceae bacterium]
MVDYIGAHCPACDKKFTDKDDIVVCPVCGTPHHRECYNRHGRCVNEERHGTFDGWKNDGKSEQAKYDGKAPLKCPSCGTLNRAESLYCQICGSRLNENPQNASVRDDDFLHYGGPVPIIPNPFTTPFGGLSPEEEIDGISAREYALFVGQNSFYFLPKFKEYNRSKMPSWNWPAFFFDFFYFLYRKMYAVAFLILGIQLVLLVPFLMFYYKLFIYVSANPEVLNSLTLRIPQSLAEYQPLIRVFNSAAFVFKGLLAMYANKIYFWHCRKKIKKLRNEYASEFNGGDYNSNEYVVRLSKNGRVNRRLMLILLGIYAVASFASILFAMY